MDNVKPMIENIEWLSEADRKKIFEDNARAVFKLVEKKMGDEARRVEDGGRAVGRL